MAQLVAGVLTPKQQDVVNYFQGLNVPASWFVGQATEGGTIEVIAIGNGEESFAWSFVIAPDGDFSSSEAAVGEFSTGINA